jgi:hypothetical protein
MDIIMVTGMFIIMSVVITAALKKAATLIGRAVPTVVISRELTATDRNMIKIIIQNMKAAAITIIQSPAADIIKQQTPVFCKRKTCEE